MKMKKVVLSAVCAGALVVGTIAGTMAYLTDATETVTNTFTVGDVQITLDELDVDDSNNDGSTQDRDMANSYKLIPGKDYVKDPTIHVAAGSEDSYLFVKVDNGISAIEAAGATTIAKQMETLGWTAVSGQSGVFMYKDTVEAGENIPVFETFVLSSDADVAQYANATITVKACAVQAEGVSAETAATQAAALLA